MRYILQPRLLKHELDHDGIYGDIWESKQNESILYLKNDDLSTVIWYVRYSKGTEEKTNFGLKNSITLPSLENKYLKKLRDEIDEPIYTSTDEFLCCFVRKSTKVGRWSALNHYHKPINSGEVFNIFSE